MYNPQLDVFVKVADCGSFSKAAEELYISPTAVMKQMNLLEDHIGVPLLVRSRHGIALTESGRQLYLDAKDMILLSEKAIQRARTAAEPQTLVVRVGTSMLYPCGQLVDLWGSIHQQYPQIKIQIIPFDDDHRKNLSIFSSLGENIDFIVAQGDSVRWEPYCSFLELDRRNFCIAVSRSHRLARASRLSLSDLHGEHLLMIEQGVSPAVDEIQALIRREHPQIILEKAYDPYDLQVFNRCEEQNWALLTLDSWGDIHPALTAIPVDWEYTLPCRLVYPKKLAAHLDIFLNAIAAALRSEPR